MVFSPRTTARIFHSMCKTHCHKEVRCATSSCYKEQASCYGCYWTATLLVTRAGRTADTAWHLLYARHEFRSHSLNLSNPGRHYSFPIFLQRQLRHRRVMNLAPGEHGGSGLDPRLCSGSSATNHAASLNKVQGLLRTCFGLGSVCLFMFLIH